MHEIGHFLQHKADEVQQKAAQPSKIEAQVVVVKTANNPVLLRRFLDTILQVATDTQALSQIIIGVLDESTQTVVQAENQKTVCNLEQNTLPIEYASTKNLNELHWLRKLGMILEEEMGYHGLAALYYLLTENKKVASTALLPRSATAIEKYGGGPIASTNVALLYGAHLAGKYSFDLRSVALTHNDDDLLYKTTVNDSKGLPVITPYDYFNFRDRALEQSLITMGKYLGVKGSPVSVVESCCHVVLGILENLRTSVPSGMMSPYPIFDESSHSYVSVPITTIRELIPQIIATALIRKPIAGHVTRDGLERMTSTDIRFDMGNFTLTHPIFSTMPFPPTGVPEYQLPSFMVYLQQKDIVSIEPPMFHHRMNPARGEYGALDHVVDKNALMQFTLEGIVAEEIGLTKGVRSFYEIKTRQLERLRHIRNYLSFRSQELSSTYPDTARTIDKLIAAISDSVLNRIQAEIEAARTSPQYVERGIQRFMNAAERWPKMVEHAWKLGCP